MQQIVVGYDGSEEAARALDRASELAKLYGCWLTVLTAADDRLRREDGMLTVAADENLARWTAEQGVSRARQAGVTNVEARVALETPADALIHAAGSGDSLLVVGHRGQGGLKELFLGSVAKDVVDRTQCSILVVR